MQLRTFSRYIEVFHGSEASMSPVMAIEREITAIPGTPSAFLVEAVQVQSFASVSLTRSVSFILSSISTSFAVNVDVVPEDTVDIVVS